MKTILTVKIHPMCELVLSIVNLTYKDLDSDSCWLLEEYGTIENLCSKYQINRIGNDEFDTRHLVGKKCIVSIKNGKTIFGQYC